MPNKDIYTVPLEYEKYYSRSTYKVDYIMDINKVSEYRGAWLDVIDNDIDGIIVSNRVRLARNIAEYNFIPKLDRFGRKCVIDAIQTAIDTVEGCNELEFLDTTEINNIESQLLVERHLASHELIEESDTCGIAFNKKENISIMINEEDHLRLQGLGGGFNLHETYEKLDEIDNAFSTVLNYAYSKDFGYLTACPTNAGTGLRVSVMIHLPALAMTGHLEKAFRAVQDLRLAIRGFYGEGSEALSNLYQISNQITLGRSEFEILNDLIAVIEELAEYETKARAKLLQESRIKIEDKIDRAYAILQSAKILSNSEAMDHLSSLRLGVNIGLIENLNLEKLNDIFLFSQEAHLQCRQGIEYLTDELDIVRAEYIREQLDCIES